MIHGCRFVRNRNAQTIDAKIITAFHERMQVVLGNAKGQRVTSIDSQMLECLVVNQRAVAMRNRIGDHSVNLGLFRWMFS